MYEALYMLSCIPFQRAIYMTNFLRKYIYFTLPKLDVISHQLDAEKILMGLMKYKYFVDSRDNLCIIIAFNNIYHLLGLNREIKYSKKLQF